MKVINALIAAALLLLLAAPPAFAAPQWRLQSGANSTVASVDDPETPVVKENEITFFTQADSIGDVSTDGSKIQILATLPPGMTAVKAQLVDFDGEAFHKCFNAADGKSPVENASAIVCSTSTKVLAWLKLELTASVAPGAEGTLVSEFQISGGGAPTVTIVDPTRVSTASPPFGIDGFDVLATADTSGAALTQAGAHPYDYTTYLDFNTEPNPDPRRGTLWPIEPPRDVLAELPPGFIGNPTIVDTCTGERLTSPGPQADGKTLCPPAAQVGTVLVRAKPGSTQGPFSVAALPVFNMEPPAGVPGRFGFNFFGTIVVLDAELRSDGDYGLTVGPRRIPPGLSAAGSTLTFWGVPSSKDHDHERSCPAERIAGERGPFCQSGASPEPFFRLPTSCTPPGEGLETSIRMNSWDDPGEFVSRTIETHEAPGYPSPESAWGEPVGITGCENVPLKAKLSATPTSIDAETSSGLAVHVEIPNPGMDNPAGIASSDIKKVRVTLPRGMTVNPSQAEGLGVCTPAQYESTVLSFFPTPGRGCPDDSKIGTVEVVTPLLEEHLFGDVHIAEQGNNPFNSLLAIYVVIKNPQKGILVKLAGKVETDETTGRIVTTFDDLPQLPFDSFDFRFREGARAPLVTPPTCGTYETTAEFWGHADPNGPPLVSNSSFEIVRGIGGGPCPPGGIPPFDPGFSAGSINNNAGSFSPVNMRLTRKDGEQNLTKFSATLAPGLLAKLAGVEKCSDASIAAAKAKTGRQELASPSCPASSQIGRSLAGAGVGSVLTYVPGQIYLAGPYNGAPLSVVAVTPAVAGPFDVGTVVVREGLSLDSVTGVASVDGAASDPIPHILEGIPLKLRDLRVYVDRDQFTLNPTSCDPDAIGATLFGSYADVFDPADDRPVDLASRFQAANCSSLGFKPRLSIKLKGGTKRGDFPGLIATLRPRPGDANLSGAVVKLPRSAFLEQGHIRTICTRVQWAQDNCPKGAVYGKVAAFTPLLDEPLRGNAYLRSSNNKLPDLVFDLKGLVDIEASAKIDSVQGGIRATFPQIPDAPLTKVVVQMKGGQKGLIVNSRNLCKAKSRADLKLDGHNGKAHDVTPVVGARCGKGRKAKRGR